MSQLNQRDDLVFAPKWLEESMRLLTRFLSVLTTAVFILLTYVIYRYSTKLMSPYRWYLLINATFCWILDLILGFCALETLLFAENLIIVHYLIPLKQYNFIGAFILLVMGVTAYIGSLFTTMWLFIFRYYQSANHPRFRFLRFSTYFASFVGVLISISVSVGYPILSNITDDSNRIALWFENYPEAYQKITTSDYVIALIRDVSYK
ncbi:hypothetical protein M3Y95_00297200 [Aphelenchoides besseyi]|nr:hypothetical protein M3Y95_00297200 [Aphelenchoides besseyi]